jgi:hypothetical protein
MSEVNPGGPGDVGEVNGSRGEDAVGQPRRGSGSSVSVE